MSRGHRSIGQVLALLVEEYPDLTISKIRFLESQGLIAPERTPSGYRKFYDSDIERLRWVLFQQRDSYMPLKEIKRRLSEAPGSEDASAGVVSEGSRVVRDASVDEPASVEVVSEGSRVVRDASVDEPASAEVVSEGSRVVRDASVDEDASADKPAPGASAAVQRQSAHPSRAVVRAGRGRSGSQLADRVPDTSLSGSGGAAFGGSGGGAGSGGAAADSDEHASAAAPVPLLFAPRASGGDADADTDNASAGRTADGEALTGVVGKKPRLVHRSPSEPRFDVSASFTADELARAMDVDTTLINGLVRMGLIVPVSPRSESDQSESVFDHEALLMVRAVVAFGALGVPARNLRMYRVAADREAGIYEQVVATLIARNDRERLRRDLGELVDLAETMRRSLLRRLLSPYLD